MTSVSFDRQNGQTGFSLPPCGGGSGWGVGPSRTGRHVPLFGEPLQHGERQLVDPAGDDAPADRVPRLPVNGGRCRRTAHLLIEPPAKLADPEAQDPLLMQLVNIAALRPDPHDGVAPRLLDGASSPRFTHPATAI